LPLHLSQQKPIFLAYLTTTVASPALPLTGQFLLTGSAEAMPAPKTRAAMSVNRVFISGMVGWLVGGSGAHTGETENDC
jgi:hypothetical protein